MVGKLLNCYDVKFWGLYLVCILLNSPFLRSWYCKGKIVVCVHCVCPIVISCLSNIALFYWTMISVRKSTRKPFLSKISIWFWEDVCLIWGIQFIDQPKKHVVFCWRGIHLVPDDTFGIRELGGAFLICLFPPPKLWKCSNFYLSKGVGSTNQPTNQTNQTHRPLPQENLFQQWIDALGNMLDSIFSKKSPRLDWRKPMGRISRHRKKP